MVDDHDGLKHYGNGAASVGDVADKEQRRAPACVKSA
jgi:hypothetical protein